MTNDETQNRITKHKRQMGAPLGRAVGNGLEVTGVSVRKRNVAMIEQALDALEEGEEGGPLPLLRVRDCSPAQQRLWAPLA